MAFSKDDVLEALKVIKDARTQRDLVSMGAVRTVASCDGFVSVTIACADEGDTRRMLKAGADSAIRQRAAAKGETIIDVAVSFIDPGAAESAAASRPRADAAPAQGGGASAPAQGARGAGGVQPMSPSLPGVKHIIAVGAGKGGVGKSTIAVNLAVGLARKGHAVGLLDGDIYGPSVPTLLGLGSMEVTLHKGMLQVFYVHGVKAMTIGKLVEADKALIWRGPMAHGAFKQLVEQTAWGELDYLVIDLPPGTGDVSLTMAQLLKVTGAVIVCTPQKVAQDDAVRAARMFQQLQIPVLGVVENMSYFIGDDGKEYDIFGRGGAQRMAQRLGLPFLGAVPIVMALRENSDGGDPTANFESAGPALRAALEEMVKQVETEVALEAMRGSGGPVVSVS